LWFGDEFLLAGKGKVIKKKFGKALKKALPKTGKHSADHAARQMVSFLLNIH